MIASGWICSYAAHAGWNADEALILMSFLDRLFGRGEQPREQPASSSWQRGGPSGPTQRRADPRSPDEIALERYRYLLRTAPPEEIERAHAEAFERLSPEQRQMALQQLSGYVPESELRSATDDPRSLARVATRAELRQPGTIERALGGQPQGYQQGRQSQGGFGGGGFGLGSVLLYSLAGSFIGTAVAQSLFGSYGYPEGDPGGDASSNIDQAGYEDGGEGGDAGGDAMDAGDGGYSSGGSWGDPGGGGDPGSDFGTADTDGGFGDFGGGDFGGGDFGGGDF